MRLSALKEWWKRYFTDNPMVWLLNYHAPVGFFLSSIPNGWVLRQQWYKALRSGDWERLEQIEQELSGASLAQRFWHPKDFRTAIVLYALTLVVVGFSLLQGVPKPVRGTLILTVITIGIVNTLPFVGYNSLVKLLSEERTHGRADLIRLTRVDSRELLYGTYLGHALAGVMRIYLIWVAPLVIAVASLLYGSPGTALWLSVRVGLCLVAQSLLWQTLQGVLMPIYSTFFWRSAFATLTVGWALIAISFSFVVFPGWLAAPGIFQWFMQTPSSLWIIHPAFWASLLFLPVAAVTAVFVIHPLWGVLQAFGVFVLTALLAPIACRQIDRALKSCEPEPVIEEGAWW